MERPEEPVDVVKNVSAKAKKKPGIGARSAHKNSDWYENAKKAVAIIVEQQKTEPVAPRTSIPLRRGKHA